MKLNSFRQRHGLAWPSKYPRINWLDWLFGLLFVVCIVLVLMMVDFIGSNVKLADSNARAVHRADHAEMVLVACLNKRPIMDGRTAIFCDPITAEL